MHQPQTDIVSVCVCVRQGVKMGQFLPSAAAADAAAAEEASTAG